jgi:tetratricopeptide (TPR) repeat protein
MVDLGKRDLESSSFEKGASKFATAIEIDPENPHAYFHLGVTRFRAGRFEEAAELFRRGADLFGETRSWKAEALAFRGESLAKIGRFAEAKESLEAALALDSANVRAAEALARISPGM